MVLDPSIVAPAEADTLIRIRRVGSVATLAKLVSGQWAIALQLFVCSASLGEPRERTSSIAGDYRHDTTTATRRTCGTPSAESL